MRYTRGLVDGSQVHQPTVTGIRWLEESDPSKTGRVRIRSQACLDERQADSAIWLRIFGDLSISLERKISGAVPSSVRCIARSTCLLLGRNLRQCI